MVVWRDERWLVSRWEERWLVVQRDKEVDSRGVVAWQVVNW